MVINEDELIKTVFDRIGYSRFYDTIVKNIGESILYGTPINTKVNHNPNKPQGNYEFIEVNYEVEE